MATAGCSRRRKGLGGLVALALLLAGCPGPAGPTGPKASRPPAARPAASQRPAPLATAVTGLPPGTGVSGPGVLANNGAALTGKVKLPASVIADRNAVFISDQGGG